MAVFMSDPVFGDEKVEFPVLCHFKVITESSAGTAAEIRSALNGLGVDAPVEEGGRSSAGRYATYNVSIMVESSEQMHSIDSALRSIKGVRMVL